MIDYVVTDERIRKEVLDTKVRIDVKMLLNSDHYMVMAKVKIRTRWVRKSRGVDIEKIRVAVEILIG